MVMRNSEFGITMRSLAMRSAEFGMRNENQEKQSAANTESSGGER